MLAELLLELYVSMTGLDTNLGTREAPLRTIARAAEVAKPGTIVRVAPGVYEGGFQTKASGTAEAPIRYVSEVKWGARIVPGPDNAIRQAWDNRGAHVVIDGFEVDGSQPKGGKPWLFGIYTAGSGSVVQNSKVHDIVRDGTAFGAANHKGQGGAGIMGDGYFKGSGITIRDNVVYNIGPASQSSTLVHGIYMATSGQVLNNLVYQVAGDGITSWHDATALDITNNTVFAANTGVMIGAGDRYHSNAPNDRSRVRNNIVYDCNRGIMEYGETGFNNTYANNLVYRNRTNWLLQFGQKPTGTVTADPKFVDYVRTGGGDYRLRTDSPAIDAGVDSGAPSFDLDGVPRPQNHRVDIGAYERAAPSRGADAARP